MVLVEGVRRAKRGVAALGAALRHSHYFAKAS